MTIAEVDHTKPFTYRAMLQIMAAMTDAQLDQEVQILPHHPMPEPIRLQPVYGVNTVEYYCHVEGEVVDETRSAVDFTHHPEQVVILADMSPFDKEGNIFFTMEEDGMRGNKTGKLYPGPFGSGDDTINGWIDGETYPAPGADYDTPTPEA